MKSMFKFWTSFFFLLIVPSKLFALPYKCDRKQEFCEVETKRWTIGDKVGIFSSDGQLAGLGEVVEIKEQIRVVKVVKKTGSLLRSFDMKVIDDEEYQEPEKHFRFLTPIPELLWGVNIGAINLGIGDSFVGTNLAGTVYWNIWRNIFLNGRLHYISGAGSASDSLNGTLGKTVSVTTLGASVGVSDLIAANEMFSFRISSDLGLTNATVTLQQDLDKKEILNNRISDGTGLYLRFGAAVILRRDGLQPEIGFEFSRIHNSNNPGLYVGVSSPID